MAKKMRGEQTPAKLYWRGTNRRHVVWKKQESGYQESDMIRKLTSGKYRLYSRKKNPRTGRRRNLGTFASRAAAEKHERAVQYFKRH
jgi:hypothetical protein